MLGSGKTWLMCVLYPCICLIPDLALNFIASVYFPTPAEVVMAEQKGKREAIHARATRMAARYGRFKKKPAPSMKKKRSKAGKKRS